MIKLIIGEKGTGKTKILIDAIKEALTRAKGNVICLDKGTKLQYNVNHKTRLINLEEYNIMGFDSFYGFVAGLLAGDYDITHIFVDSILKVVGKGDYDALGEMFDKLNDIAKDIELVFTVSADKEALPESVLKYV